MKDQYDSGLDYAIVYVHGQILAPIWNEERAAYTTTETARLAPSSPVTTAKWTNFLGDDK